MSNNEKLIQQGLKQLTDEELIQYHNLYKFMIDISGRAEGTKITGVDRKHLYHVVRLIGEVEQLLAIGDMDIQQDKERLRAIREGKWTMGQVKSFFVEKEKALESLYNSSELPYKPREEEIKALLVKCLEMHYGDLSSNELVIPGKAEAALRQIQEIIAKTDI
jgi:uncharacterized protein